MNWRAIRIALLLMLIILNLGLLAYNVILSRERYVVPDERIQLLREQYERKGYTLPEDLPVEQYPMKRLQLQEMDLEQRADGFWNKEYEKSYMIGSKILYTCESEVLTIDRDNSTMQYIQHLPKYEPGATVEDDQRLAISFARIMMEEESLELLQVQKGPEGADIYTFCQKYDDQLIFCNRIAVSVYQGAIIEAYMQQYQISGYEEEERFIYPVDEVLFACLDEIRSSPDGGTLKLYYGYDMVPSGTNRYFGEPHILIYNGDEQGLLVNQYTVEFNILQYS